MDSFLNNRSCAIYDGEETGDEFIPTAGVAQGVILSPTLYNIFVADLPEPDNKNTVNIIFADDITQIITSRNENTYQKLIKTEIEKMNNFER